jgi:hypothetical protein
MTQRGEACLRLDFIATITFADFPLSNHQVGRLCFIRSAASFSRVGVPLYKIPIAPEYETMRWGRVSSSGTFSAMPHFYLDEVVSKETYIRLHMLN